MNFQKLKQMVILTDNLEMDDVLRLVRRKVRQYVFSDNFKFDIDHNITSTDYVTIVFRIGSLICRWSIHKNGFICYHNMNCVDNTLGGFLSEDEEKAFCELFYSKLYKEKDGQNETQSVKSQISALEKTLNALNNNNTTH